MVPDEKIEAMKAELAARQAKQPGGKFSGSMQLLADRPISVAIRQMVQEGQLTMRMQYACEIYARTFNEDTAATMACYASTKDFTREFGQSIPAQEYLTELLRKKTDDAQITDEEIRIGLLDNAREATKAGNFSAAHQCWKTLAIMKGLLTPTGRTKEAGPASGIFELVQSGPADLERSA